MTPGKVLGLDWGEVRCGWALSDAGAVLAGRSGTYARVSPEADLDFFKRMVEAEGVVEVALGVPYNMDGSLGPQARAVLAAGEALAAALGVPVVEVDERLTSAEAERVMLEGGLSRRRRKRQRDALAAVLILQAHLDRRRRSR